MPDPAQVGWDQHFGYGRPDLGLALERIDEGKIPPQALITGPDWFGPLEPRAPDDASRSAAGCPPARGRRTPGQLQWAPGIEPAEARLLDREHAERRAPIDGALGTIDLNAVRAALDARTGGGATTDPTAPAKGVGDTDPNEPAFTVRVARHRRRRATAARTARCCSPTATPRCTPAGRGTRGTGGEASQRL